MWQDRMERIQVSSRVSHWSGKRGHFALSCTAGGCAGVKLYQRTAVHGGHAYGAGPRWDPGDRTQRCCVSPSFLCCGGCSSDKGAVAVVCIRAVVGAGCSAGNCLRQ